MTLLILSVTCMSFSLKFRFQVNCECQITMWIYDHHSFCSRDPTSPRDIIKIFALSQPLILFSKGALKRYHSCSPMSAKKKYKKFCWAATHCTELNKSSLPEELQSLCIWKELAFFPSSLGFSIMTSGIAVEVMWRFLRYEIQFLLYFINDCATFLTYFYFRVEQSACWDKPFWRQLTLELCSSSALSLSLKIHIIISGIIQMKF